MNPSKELWITKFFKLSNPSFFNELTETLFYEEIRKTGFVYGYTTTTIQPVFNSFELSLEEVTKIVLLESLWGTYIQETKNHNVKDFIEKTEAFYSKINTVETDSYFSFIRFSTNGKKYRSLEKIINDRVQNSSNYIEKTFSHHLANFLLFTDVLCFKRYLMNEKDILSYYKYLENTLFQLALICFNQKQNHTKYDIKLQELLQNSLRFTSTTSHFAKDLDHLDTSNIITFYGKAYLYDVSLMVLWNDEKIDEKEFEFTVRLIQKLQLSISFSQNSLDNMLLFLDQHKEEIPYFQFSHPIKKLYKSTNKNIALLIKRNKKSIVKEISNNKLLLQLLVKSTYSSLTKSEKAMLKKQLIELGKTIPAFTIFLIPGGSLLLPILIKLLPELIPDSFNENKR